MEEMKESMVRYRIWWVAIGWWMLGSNAHLAAQPAGDWKALIGRNFSREAQLRAWEGLDAADYLSESERDAIGIVNLARLFPQAFDSLFLDWLQEEDGGDAQEKFDAGDAFFATLHARLLNQRPLPPLVPSRKYWKCARFWARYSARHDLVGHNRPWYPIRYQAEVCDYHYDDSPLAMVMDLLVDEGVKSLGHRNILLGKWLHVGASLVPHPRHGYCLVMDFGE